MTPRGISSVGRGRGLAVLPHPALGRAFNRVVATRSEGAERPGARPGLAVPVAPEVGVVLYPAAVRRLAVDRADDAVGADLEGVTTGAEDVVAVRPLGDAGAAAVDATAQRREVHDERDTDRGRGGRRRCRR